MVVKLFTIFADSVRGFESSVISYGSQTKDFVYALDRAFESSVISYGSQTNLLSIYIEK